MVYWNPNFFKHIISFYLHNSTSSHYFSFTSSLPSRETSPQHLQIWGRESGQTTEKKDSVIHLTSCQEKSERIVKTPAGPSQERVHSQIWDVPFTEDIRPNVLGCQSGHFYSKEGHIWGGKEKIYSTLCPMIWCFAGPIVGSFRG